jgi:glyoxylase-like metal-dependent hydrolase (beta-lactamase superfamily II)
MAAQHIRTWRIGRVEISRLVELWRFDDDLAMLLEGGHPGMLLERPWLAPDHATPEGRMVINFQGFLIKVGNRRIIVDSCIGSDRQREYAVFCNLQSQFLEDLATLGVAPDDVDTVLCTHLHFDHVGWNTHWVAGRWVPTFPKARYLFGKTEHEHWMMLRDTGGYHDVRHLKECIDPIVERGLADFVGMDHRISDEIWLEPSPGHTPGHVSVHIASEGQDAILTGDLMHHPLQIALPRHPARFDMNRDAGADTRARFVERYRNRAALVIGSHFSGPTAGWIVPEGDGWRFEGQS